MKRPTVKNDKECKLKNILMKYLMRDARFCITELKINTKIGTRVQCPESALLNAIKVVNVTFNQLNSAALETPKEC